MKTARKAKVSVTLDRDLLAAIDRRVEPGATRSEVIEAWLRLAALAHARRELDAATVACYEGRTVALALTTSVVSEMLAAQHGLAPPGVLVRHLRHDGHLRGARQPGRARHRHLQPDGAPREASGPLALAIDARAADRAA